MKADMVIEKLGEGSLTATAKALDLPIPTVQHWKKTNRVPKWREAHVRAAAQMKRVSLED